MATFNQVFEGMKIIKKYARTNDLDTHGFEAEHDQFWCMDYTGDEMSEEDFARMEELGWFESEQAWSRFT